MSAVDDRKRLRVPRETEPARQAYAQLEYVRTRCLHARNKVNGSLDVRTRQLSKARLGSLSRHGRSAEGTPR
jgi:hypothetical protein